MTNDDWGGETVWIVIREVKSNELRLKEVHAEFRPSAERGFTWGGPYLTEAAAREACALADGELGRQLYPEGFTLAPPICELCGKPMGEETGDTHGACHDQEQFLADQIPGKPIPTA